MIDPKYLLNDQQMCDYITQGFLVLKTDLPSSVHEQIYRRTSKVMEKEGEDYQQQMFRQDFSNE